MLKKKVATTENNYREVMLKRAIILCWILLAICFVIKICGGNFFDIICNNDRFIKLCEFIDRAIIKYIIYFILFQITMYLLLIIVKPEIKIKSNSYIKYFIIMIIYWIYKLLIELNIINIQYYYIDIIDFIIPIIILYLYTHNLKKSLFTILLLFIFTLLSTITKNITIEQVVTDSYLIATLYSIDYYIMLVLSALYSRKVYLRRNI